MENIIVIINKDHFKKSPLKLAINLTKGRDARLIGYVMESVYLEYIPIASDFPPYMENLPAVEKPAGAKADVSSDLAVNVFIEMCQEAAVPYEIMETKDNTVEKVIWETKYADLIVLDPQTPIYDNYEGVPSPFVRDILTRAKCPVVLAPALVEDWDEIIFCYDDSPASIYAIKHFTYLLPEYRDRKVTVLEVSDSDNKEFDEGHRRIMSWLRANYASVNYHQLRGKVKDELFTYLFLKRNKFVVMGAYGRNQLSQFFRHSSAEKVIDLVDLPVFIAHQ